MLYLPVFDVIDVGYRYWWFPVVFLVFLGLILGELFLRKIISSWKPSRFRKWYFYSGTGFCMLWSLQSFYGTYSDYAELRRALQEGKTDVVEGKIENFIPMPYSGHSMESFTVAGRKFEYSDYTVTAGFNKTSSHGGPLSPGIQVKIYAVGNKIARLEIAK